MGAADEYANKLEHWFYSLPGFVQSALHQPFTWMNDGLKAVAGQPQELLAAGGHYIEIGEAVHRIGQEQLTSRLALAGHWTGDAYDAFSQKTLEIEQQLDKLAEAVKKAKELLESGAKACVEGANMIIDIVVTLIMLVLADLAVGVALSVLSFGASLAAMVAKWIADGLMALSRVARVLQKTAQILKKLAEIFYKVEKLFQKIAKVLKELKEVLKDSLALKKGAKGWDKVGATVSHGIVRGVMAKGIWAATGGTVNIPGPLGSGYKAGKDYVEASQDAGDATDAAGP